MISNIYITGWFIGHLPTFTCMLRSKCVSGLTSSIYHLPTPFKQFYSLVYIIWCKITGTYPADYPLHTSIFVFRLFLSKRYKASLEKGSSRISLVHLCHFYIESKQICLVEPVVVTLKGWSQMLLQKVQKNQHKLLWMHDTKINMRVLK